MGINRRVEDHYVVRIDQGRMVLLGIGAALVLSLVFLVGVMVGKSLWEPRSPLTVSTERYAQPVEPPPEPVAEPKYTFYDDVRNADAAGSRPTPIQPRNPLAPEPVATADKKPVPVPESAREAAQAQPAPKPSGPVFTVQVGSFRDRASAERHRADLKRKGVESEIVTARVDNQDWYRLQVGRFDSRDKAQAHYRDRLVPKGIKGFVLAR